MAIRGNGVVEFGDELEIYYVFQHVTEHRGLLLCRLREQPAGDLHDVRLSEALIRTIRTDLLVLASED